MSKSNKFATLFPLTFQFVPFYLYTPDRDDVHDALGCRRPSNKRQMSKPYRDLQNFYVLIIKKKFQFFTSLIQTYQVTVNNVLIIFVIIEMAYTVHIFTCTHTHIFFSYTRSRVYIYTLKLVYLHTFFFTHTHTYKLHSLSHVHTHTFRVIGQSTHIHIFSNIQHTYTSYIHTYTHILLIYQSIMTDNSFTFLSQLLSSPLILYIFCKMYI